MNTCARGCCTGPNAQRDHYRSIQWGSASGPTAETLRERQLQKDLAAYKDAKDTGTNLKTYVGAADFNDQVQSKVEVDRGYLIKNARMLRQVEKYTAEAAPISTTPVEPGSL